jgi:hypothetical protein
MNWQDVPATDGVSQLRLTHANAAAFFRLLRP